MISRYKACRRRLHRGRVLFQLFPPVTSCYPWSWTELRFHHIRFDRFVFSLLEMAAPKYDSTIAYQSVSPEIIYERKWREASTRTWLSSTTCKETELGSYSSRTGPFAPLARTCGCLTIPQLYGLYYRCIGLVSWRTVLAIALQPHYFCNAAEVARIRQRVPQLVGWLAVSCESARGVVRLHCGSAGLSRHHGLLQP